MKIRQILALLFFMFCTTIFAQGRDYINEMEQNDLQIRQKPNTEGLLSDYLHSANIKEDTIFAILYSPAECFRCEAAIPAFYDKLKRNNPNNKLLLITAYGDSKTASWYNSIRLIITFMIRNQFIATSSVSTLKECTDCIYSN